MEIGENQEYQNHLIILIHFDLRSKYMEIPFT